jgi:outer membrane protein TolC
VLGIGALTLLQGCPARGAEPVASAKHLDADTPPPPPPADSVSSDALLSDLADRMENLAQAAEQKATPAGGAVPNSDRISNVKLKPLPAEPAVNHAANSILQMGPFHRGALVPLPLLQPIELDASYSRPLSLEEALDYAIQNSLAIKISRESWNYQRWQYLSALSSALPIPSFSMSYNLTNSNILSSNTLSNATVFQTTVRYPVFQGGGAVFGAIAQHYREKGWHGAYYTSINDALLDVYQKYATLELQHVLLQIRAKAVQVSEAQLHLNNTLYVAGSATRLSIMQSRTQLAADREALIEQQIAVRVAALALSFALDMPMESNIIPQTETIQEEPLIAPDLSVNQLLDIAVENRPDLRQYEMFRLAAARNIQVAASALYPQASFFTSYTNSKTVVTQNTSAAAVAAAAAAAATNSSFQNTAGAGVFGGLFTTLQAGFSLTWSLSNLGLTSAVNVKSAQILARQALMQANQALLLANEQVRADYSGRMVARIRIDNGAYGVASGREALRLASLRLAAGTGTNIDSIQAQRDYINALVTQAQAIINANIVQAQLLHDIGVISKDTLLHGFTSHTEPLPLNPPGGS